MLRAYDEGRLFGVLTGAAPPQVIALHGWGRNHRDFDDVLGGFDALALDLPGFGASPPPPSAWGGAEYAKSVLRVLDELAAPRAVLIGHSFGGQVAVHIAAAAPERVRALVLTGTPLIRRPKGATRSPVFRAVRWLHRRGLVSDARMEERRRRHGSADYRAASGVMREFYVRVVNESYDDELTRVSCPVELVWGEDDAAAPIEMAETALGLLPDARLERIRGVGHFTPQAAGDALRAAMAKHLP